MMKFCLDNIGIVKESEIELNGITVITGHNNSGKTTVSKALYSIVSSVENLGKNNLRDKNNATEAFVNNLISEIWLRSSTHKEEGNLTNKMTIPYNPELLEEEGAERYLEIFRENECRMLENAAQEATKRETQEFYVDLQHSFERKVEDFGKRLRFEYEPVNYVNKKLDSILNAEFNEQVLPVNGDVDSGIIRLFADEKKIFDVVVNEQGLSRRKETFSMSLFDSRCIFIDDVYVLDELIEKVEKEDKNAGLFWSKLIKDTAPKIKIEKHKQKLINSLWQKEGRIYGSALDKEKAEKIYDKLAYVFNDKIVLESGKLVCANSKIHVGNLAMGAKVFALLRMLLDNGTITKDTILILDEPEVHLHPEWQNVLAELLVLIMQEIHATILLTTHSSQFLMALETYTKQYKQHEWFKVYTTERLENSRFVKYVDCTERIKDVYYKLAKPMFDIKILKDNIEE